jgi:hypothetical protein
MYSFAVRPCFALAIMICGTAVPANIQSDKAPNTWLSSSAVPLMSGHCSQGTHGSDILAGERNGRAIEPCGGLIAVAPAKTVHGAGRGRKKVDLQKPIKEPCPQESIPEKDQCLDARNATIQRTYNKYLAAAFKEAKVYDDPDFPGGEKIYPRLKLANSKFLEYRKEQCGALSDIYSVGAMAYGIRVTCISYLTQLQTHILWSQWLNHDGEGSAILPRPPVDPVYWR